VDEIRQEGICLERGKGDGMGWMKWDLEGVVGQLVELKSTFRGNCVELRVRYINETQSI
jgi:hypothetical protein